jgi:hypothetical protein
VAGPDELQALVEAARVDRKQRLGNPSGRLVDLRPPELADWRFANRHARPFLAVSAAKQQSSLHLVRPSCAALGAPGANMKHEHYGNFIVADAAPDETDQRATARMNSALVGMRIASRPLQG